MSQPSRMIKLFEKKFASVLGMVHVGALPGTPRSRYTVQQLVDFACKEVEIYKNCDLDGVIIENMHDIPYVKEDRIGPEIIACMTTVAKEVRRVSASIPIGVQILAGANQQALAVALAADLDFIRAEGFVFGHVADEGAIDACAGPLLRYRKQIGAEHVQVFADIKKKHSSHAITSDISLEATAEAATFFLCDGVIITGSHTGDAVLPEVFQKLKASVGVDSRILIGSGVTLDNSHWFKDASGLIVGSHFKKGGRWQNEIEEDRVKKFMDQVSKWK